MNTHFSIRVSVLVKAAKTPTLDGQRQSGTKALLKWRQVSKNWRHGIHAELAILEKLPWQHASILRLLASVPDNVNLAGLTCE